MRVELWSDPLAVKPLQVWDVEDALKVVDIFDHIGMPEDHHFRSTGAVRFDGLLIDAEYWHVIKPKPDKVSVIELCLIPQGNDVLKSLIQVASIVAQGFLIAIGQPLLAAGVGILSQLAIGLLSGPPQVANDTGGAQKQLVQAGISQNPLVLNDVLAVPFGKIRFAPQQLLPFHMEFTQTESRIVGVVGCEGRNLVENILINGLSIDKFPDISIETREGSAADLPRTICSTTNVEINTPDIFSTWTLNPLTSFNTQLADQVTPINSSPKWHYAATAGKLEDFGVQIVWPNGISKSDDKTQAMVPVRIEAKYKTDLTWRKFPTAHFTDLKKGAGLLRQEIAFKRQTLPAGVHYGYAAGIYACFDMHNVTGLGQTFEYRADPYFIDDNLNHVALMNTMTGYTGGGYTIAASSEFSGSTNAWRVWGTNTFGSNWQPADNSLPAWLTFQYPAAVTWKHVEIYCDTASPGGTAPTAMKIEGSNNGGTTWIDLCPGMPPFGKQPTINYLMQFQIGNPGSYLLYRATFLTNNGAPNNVIRIAQFSPFNDDIRSPILSSTSVTYDKFHNSAGNALDAKPICRYASLTANGVNFYLDPAQWPDGEYEFRFMMGWAQAYSTFDSSYYSFSGTGQPQNASYFDTVNSGGVLSIVQAQNIFQVSGQIDRFQSRNAKMPFNPIGKTLIAISAPNLQIQSITAEFTRYAPIWSGSVWTDQPVPTKNAAAHYRQLLLGGGFAGEPIPGELIDEDSLIERYQQGFECNMVMQGVLVEQALQTLASAMFASPRSAEIFGVVPDKHDPNGPLTGPPITPMNSLDMGSTIDFPKLPHAIAATYNDETNLYKQAQVTVYRDGYDVTNARNIQAITYQGITNAESVAKRATYDLKQLSSRMRKYNRKVYWMGNRLRKGMTVPLNDNVVDRNQGIGRIVAIKRNVSNLIVSLTLDNTIKWGRAQVFSNLDDLTSVPDVANTSQVMGCAIEVAGQALSVRAVTEIADSNICTFVTPFADTTDVQLGALVLCGTLGKTHRRVKIIKVTPQGHDQFTVQMVDEAPELTAPL